MKMVHRLTPQVQALMDREKALPPISADATDLAAYRALLQDVVAAGAAVPEGSSRDALSELMYRLASEIIVETGEALDTPMLKSFEAVPVADADGGDPEPPTETQPVAVEKPRGNRRRAGGGGTPANQTTPPASPDEVDQRRAYELISWSAMAREWKKAERDGRPSSGMLVSGDALTTAEGFARDDPNIAAFVQASKDALKQRRLKGAIAALCIGFVLLLGAGWFYMEAKAAEARAELEAAERQAEADRELERVQTQARHDLRIAEVQAQNTNAVITAVQALAAHDIVPLKDLLYEVAGRTSSTEIELLMIDPEAQLPEDDTATVLASDTSEAKIAAGIEVISAGLPGLLEVAPSPLLTPASDATKAQLAALWPTDDTCKGAMWIGNSDDSRIEEAADPAQLQAGQNVTVISPGSINMRAGMPSQAGAPEGDYKLKPVQGVVPNGALVQLDGAPVGYEREGINRYWAEVTVPRQFCTKVFLQYVGSGTEAQKFVDTIAAQGFIVPSPEEIDTAAGLSEIRFYSDKDAEFVKQIAAAMESADLADSVMTWPLPPPKGGGEGVIEVWLDLS